MSHPTSRCSGPPQHQSNSRRQPTSPDVLATEGRPNEIGTSHTSQTRPDHSGAADHGSTTQEKLENRDKHNQLRSIPGHTRAVHQGTTPTPTQTTQGRYVTHPTRPPSPQHNVIPVSFKSLRRRWRRWRRRWRRNSGTLYNPPGGGLMEQGYLCHIIMASMDSDSGIVWRRNWAQ